MHTAPTAELPNDSQQAADKIAELGAEHKNTDAKRDKDAEENFELEVEHIPKLCVVALSTNETAGLRTELPKESQQTPDTIAD